MYDSPVRPVSPACHKMLISSSAVKFQQRIGKLFINPGCNQFAALSITFYPALLPSSRKAIQLHSRSALHAQNPVGTRYFCFIFQELKSCDPALGKFRQSPIVGCKKPFVSCNLKCTIQTVPSSNRISRRISYPQAMADLSEARSA